jgi:hypothetical protein
MKRLITVTWVVLFTLNSFAQDASIKRIFENPGKHVGEIVEVQGNVTQYVPAGTRTTAYYYLRGDFGNEIKVQASVSGAPETTKKYKVKGYFNIINSEYIVQETSRESLERPAPARVQHADRELRRQEELMKQKSDNTLIYIIIGIAALLIIVLILVFTRKKQETIDYSKNTGYADPPHTIPVNPPPVSSPETIRTDSESQGFKTIRFVSSPKTMRFIPGQFTITTQEDKGKSFRITGYPMHGDSVVTIGREEVKGERSYAHIKIDDKFKTVSRKQAELIYSNQILWVVNKSESNYTQVDGYELRPGEKKEVQNGGIIRMGELEFKYTV